MHSKVALVEDRDQMLALYMQYHSTARAEILKRITQRDSALLLFLASIGTLFGIALNQDSFVLLLIVPLLGLGAAYIYSNHSDIIGALGRYVAVESSEWLANRYQNEDPPVQWDSSESFLEMRGRPTLSIFSSGIALVLLPEVLAIAIAALQLPMNPVSLIAIMGGGVAALFTALLLLASLRRRRQLALEIRQHQLGFIRLTK